jgi:SAM-dependent methyltransferase/uncharacterized protein YbaR (Trm112 family)
LRRRHFEELAPVCPRCRAAGSGDAALVIGGIAREAGDDIIEGVLHCPNDGCRMEYPIIDGIPIIVREVAKYLSDNLWHITLRDDLSPLLETILGDAAGPGSTFDATRYHLSSYVHDHWAEYDPQESAAAALPGAVARCLAAGLDLLADALPSGPNLDIGCAVGRSSVVLAERTRGLTLGVDMNFSMLRLARRVLTAGEVVYPRRRIGVVYDRRAFRVPVAVAELLDFWVCDALALPFAAGRFAVVSALNVLDCVSAPQALLASIADLVAPGGGAILATPYDWSANVTQPQAWIGGHSQRATAAGAAEPQLRALLTPGAHPLASSRLRIAGEITDFPWHVRLHDRSTVSYSTHLVAARVPAAD